MTVVQQVSRAVRSALRGDLVDWVCPVCASAEQVTPYEREFRIGHAEVCDDCRGDRA